ncbi:MAG: membrane dipeptidase [Clostridia bacterium]|nr:membrane dipeptidase [Clostridia bacterium]
MNLFDLHCDTALELYLQNQPLKDNTLHVSLGKSAPFDSYIQTMAVWSDRSLSNEDAYRQFLKTASRLKDELKANEIPLIRQGTSLRQKPARGVILAVEDARILNSDLARLDYLYRLGVRFLTLMWGGTTCIGGSHDTDAPLTDFGRTVVETCFEIGIVPDVSHASRQVTAEVIAMAKQARRPIIATHSNAFAVHPHSRNLTDEEFSAIVESGGIVGISLCRPHLTDGDCTIADVIRHIKHYLHLGGEDALCLGCDFDGIDTPPDGIADLSDLPALYRAMLDSGISEEITQKIFFENAYGFTAANI